MGPIIGQRADYNEEGFERPGARTQQKLTQVTFSCLVTQRDK